MIIDGTAGLTFNNATTQASAGVVLQVVNGTATTGVGVSTTTPTDTGLTATITPKFSTSKILVLVTQSARFSRGTNEQGHALTLLRGSTTLVSEGDRYGGYIYSNTTTSIDFAVQTPIIYLDSPATTSATTYKTQGRPLATTSSGSVTYQSESQISTITLMEIAV
jgi:hypothetical protein